jgi:hypothetical protein
LVFDFLFVFVNEKQKQKVIRDANKITMV